MTFIDEFRQHKTIMKDPDKMVEFMALRREALNKLKELNPDKTFIKHSINILWKCKHNIKHIVWSCNNEELNLISNYEHYCDGCCKEINRIEETENKVHNIKLNELDNLGDKNSD